MKAVVAVCILAAPLLLAFPAAAQQNCAGLTGVKLRSCQLNAAASSAHAQQSTGAAANQKQAELADIDGKIASAQSQLASLNRQPNTPQRNEALQIMKQFLAKMQESRASIIANVR